MVGRDRIDRLARQPEMKRMKSVTAARHRSGGHDPERLAARAHLRHQPGRRRSLIGRDPIRPQPDDVGAGIGEGVDRDRGRDERNSGDVRLDRLDPAQVVKRAHADDYPIGHAMLADHAKHIRKLHIAAGFDVDQQPRPARRDQAQHVGEARDALAGEGGRGLAAGVERLDLTERHSAHRAAAVGRAIDRRIVHHDRLAVGRRAQVELDGIDAHVDRAAKGGDGILRHTRRQPAMRHHQRLAEGHGLRGEPEHRRHGGGT